MVVMVVVVVLKDINDEVGLGDIDEVKVEFECKKKWNCDEDKDVSEVFIFFVKKLKKEKEEKVSKKDKKKEKVWIFVN